MSTYQTIRPGEKSSLLGHPGAVIIKHTCCDLERGQYNARSKRAGCCARLCKFLFHLIIGTLALVTVLRYTNSRSLRLPQTHHNWRLNLFDTLPHDPTCSAPISFQSGEMKYTFDPNVDSKPSSFHFIQQWNKTSIVPPASPLIQTTGRVIVRDAGADAIHPVTVDLDIHVSHEELKDAINVKEDVSGVTIESQTSLKAFSAMNPCISILATISVALSANISLFDVETIVLPIELQAKLNLVAETLYLRSISGSISAEVESESRKVELETTSGRISGSYPLADLLSIKTVSGTIDVDVQPKDNGPVPKTGALVVRTTSGDVRVNTDFSSIPDRNFSAQVNSISGTINGSFLPGRSTFDSKSGTIDASFPEAWEGSMQATTMTGTVTLLGDGIKIIKDTSKFGPIGRTVIAEKGNGTSHVSANTISGSLTLEF